MMSISPFGHKVVVDLSGRQDVKDINHTLALAVGVLFRGARSIHINHVRENAA